MISITINGPDQREKLAALKLPCRFGRQADQSNPELSIVDPFVSRQHVELKLVNDAQELGVRCVGSSAIGLETGESIVPDQERCLRFPVKMRIGRTDLVIEKLNVGVSFLKPMTSQVIEGRRRGPVESLALLQQGAVSPERLVEWFEGLVALQESATGADGFFQQAARAVVEMIGLDRCVVVACQKEWKVEVEYGQPSPDGMVYSHSVVGHVLAYRQTAFVEEQPGAPSPDSEINTDGWSAYVGAPIFDGDGTVVACLFGARDTKLGANLRGIRPLEAQLVQVAAGIVGSRLARLAAEAEQTRTQVQLEQFASPQLVREMQSNPQWLEAQQRELTLLFGDIRGFSNLGSRLDAAEIYALVRDVMDCMTQVIHDHGGFVFNFAGDGIAAMWNAPGRTLTHAEEACNAAIEIQDALKDVDARWSKQVGRSVEVGLGINTGTALVGNSGSKERLKYSPIGHAVNLASRVEGATKTFGAPILITESTRHSIDGKFATCDLGEIVVVGIDRPTRVFYLAGKDASARLPWWSSFTSTLEQFEQGHLELAQVAAAELLQQFPNEKAVQILSQRIEQSDGSANPWVLSGK